MGINGSTVDWMVNAFDIVDGDVSTTCWIETNVGTVEVNSGDFFEVRITLVTCNTSDAAGNTAICGFNVTVKGKISCSLFIIYLSISSGSFFIDLKVSGYVKG